MPAAPRWSPRSSYPLRALRSLRSLYWTVALAALVAGPSATALAAPIVLEDGVALLEVDPNSQDGLTGWTLNGVPHVRTQWFWLGNGGPGGEHSLETLGLVSALASDANGDGHDETLTLSYADANLAATLRYSLSGTPIGGAPGDPVDSELLLDITLEAIGDAPASVRLFEYTDVDLFNSYADDAALFSGNPRVARVTDSSGLGAYDSSWSLAPGTVEAALYSNTLDRLLDGNPTMLSNVLAASGDLTLATAWFLTLEPGAPISFRQTQSLTSVPEPGAALLLLLGLAGLGLRQEKTR